MESYKIAEGNSEEQMIGRFEDWKQRELFIFQFKDNISRYFTHPEELKFCPKCGAERVKGLDKCSCGYIYPKKGLSGCAIAAIIVCVLIIPTLAILGVVAALTVPTLVNRQSDLAAVTKLRKAISKYEAVAAIYMAENETKNLTYAFGPNCDGIEDFFKTVKRDGCNFQTADGVY